MRAIANLKESGLPVDLVAVCDIYKPRREAKQRRFGIARLYATHRELLADKEGEESIGEEGIAD